MPSDDQTTQTGRPSPRRPQRQNGIVVGFLRWRWLDGLRRGAMAATIAITVATLSLLPDFGWLEATQILLALAAMRVVARAVEDEPHPLPFHDGTLIAAAGFWGAMVTTFATLAGGEIGTEAINLAACAVLAFCGLRLRALEAFAWE
ncbi:MAG: hypothetical protein JHC87_04655 [Thermoleophilaceae bacterium]|nr:hypothetical protein [Thermoleophilaceae bacterium]